MSSLQVNATDHPRRKRELPMSSALPVWVVASMAGWAVIAVLLLGGTDISGSSDDIANTDVRDLTNFETAAGSAEK